MVVGMEACCRRKEKEVIAKQQLPIGGSYNMFVAEI
jgi:hypothetical protein